MYENPSIQKLVVDYGCIAIFSCRCNNITMDNIP
jgi:hypothetical protein